MPYSEPIPVEQATEWIRHDDGTRTYSDVLVAASSGTTTSWSDLTKSITNLYRAGYALVKVLPETAQSALNPDDRVSHAVHGTGVVLSVGTESCFVRFGSEPISHGDAVFHTPAERRVPTEELTLLDDKAANQ